MSKAREWPGVGICSAVAQGAGGGGGGLGAGGID